MLYTRHVIRGTHRGRRRDLGLFIDSGQFELTGALCPGLGHAIGNAVTALFRPFPSGRTPACTLQFRRTGEFRMV